MSEPKPASPSGVDSLPLVATWLGREAFEPCLERQLRQRDAVVAGEAPESIFLVEHPPTITLGRRASHEDLRWSSERLSEEGLAVADTPRGGEATLHAPGQLVAYPILHVGRKIRAHIVDLAEVSRRLLEELGVSGAQFDMSHPGLWLVDGNTHSADAAPSASGHKIASIGIHVSRGATVQGISINIGVDEKLFGALVSCGMPSVRMRSAADLIGSEPPALSLLARRWAELWAEQHGRPLHWRADPPPPSELLS